MSERGLLSEDSFFLSRSIGALSVQEIISKQSVKLPAWLINYVKSLKGEVWEESLLIEGSGNRPYVSHRFCVQFQTTGHRSLERHYMSSLGQPGWVTNDAIRLDIFRQYWRFLFDSGQTKDEFPPDFDLRWEARETVY